MRTPRSPADLAASTDNAASGVPCYPDGSTGMRVQAVYVRASDVPDRYPDIVGLVEQWAANAGKVFSDSAAESGGVRHVRWVTDANCDLVVERVQVTPSGDDSFSATTTELRSLGFDRADRKYVLWVDANIYCGIAGIWGDDRVGPDNANNTGPSFARIDNGCWGLADSVEAHELMHNLGGVQLSAPHATGGWHCMDENDRMCYVDASGVTMTYPCSSSSERVFDCNDDDYFSVAPPAGSYLASHWNTAFSGFLEATHPPSPTTTSSSTTTTTTLPLPTTTTTAPVRTTTVNYPGSLTRKAPSRGYAFLSGTGDVEAIVRFTKTSTLRLKIVDSSGIVVREVAGSSPVAATASVRAGRYTAVISGSTTASFTLELTYPSP